MYLPAHYQERPRVVQAARLTQETLPEVSQLLRSCVSDPGEHDVCFIDLPSGPLVVDWGDWVLREGDCIETVPPALFELMYQPYLTV